MTTEQLISKFNNEFGLEKWPKTYNVDPETYANVCQSVFNLIAENGLVQGGTIRISIGFHNNGILFKNVELILSNEVK